MPKGALAPQARIQELRAMGLSNKGISRTLEREGLGIWSTVTISRLAGAKRLEPIDRDFALVLRSAGLTWWKVWVCYTASGRQASNWKVIWRACHAPAPKAPKEGQGEV